MYKREPILSIRQFGLADSVRSLKKRIPGMCRVLRNTAPLLYDGEAVRRGYASYTAVTAPTGMEVLKVVPIQSPAQDDIHIWFASNSGQKVYVNPWYQGTVKQTTNLLINETLLAVNPTDVDVTISSTNTITVANAVTNGFSGTTGYYNGWVINKNGTSQYAQVSTYVVTAGTAVFTTIEDIGSSGFGWTSSAVFNLYRNFHDNLTFAPAYNTDLANAPSAIGENSIVRFSGGQSSTVGNRGIFYAPYLTRLFFGATARPYTYSGSYVSERELKAPTKAILNASEVFTNATTVTGTSLDALKTYWVAIAYVYDGYQIGPLCKFESTSDYVAEDANTSWSNNYLITSAAPAGFDLQFNVPLATLNKRITGLAIYIAQDDGDTRTKGRKTPYFFIEYVPFAINTPVIWSFSGGANEYYKPSGTVFYAGAQWNARGNTYVRDAGYVETPTDTMYAYSDEVIFSGKHYLSNAYVTSETFVDRQNIFTNPTGGNASLNAGLNQPDIFSNEQGIYRIMPDPTIGTKINGMVPLGLEEILIARDRGLLIGRPQVDPLGFVEFIWTKLSDDVGSSTLAQMIQADDGYIYFAGYDDIYRYRQGTYEPLIQHGEKNDWLYSYREAVSKTYKENIVIWYLPEGVVYFDINQTNGYQFAFYPPRVLGGEVTSNYGWRQVSFKQTSGLTASQFFKWMNTLQGGTVIGVTTDSPAVVMQFSNPSTQAFYYSDNGTAIKPQIDTGDFVPSGNMALDFRWDKIVFDKALDAGTSGTLDVAIYKDRLPLRTAGNLTKTIERLEVSSLADEPRIGQEWRFVYNANASSPEVMQSGSTVFQLNSIDLYGDVQAYAKRAIQQESSGCILTTGTISGLREFLIVNANTNETFTFDVPFESTYTGVEGAGVPSWRLLIFSARAQSGAELASSDILITSPTLTGFVARSPEPNTLVKYAMA